ncbi:MAG: tetratricopeptide (TPR) repeat protein [Pseudohongiellaceae bacterium]|jgi:tetratricopeptide (TPR) repeat protein
MHTITLAMALLSAALPLFNGCSAPALFPDADAVESARIYFNEERFEQASDLAEAVLMGDFEETFSAEALAEAAWVAAEAEMALGLDVKAFKNYRQLLETAPWSPHVVSIERRLFEIGERLLYDERYGGFFDSRGRGVEVLTLLQVHYRHSDLADDALRDIAAYFASEGIEEWLEASLTYEQLFDEYPDSEWAERSLWLAAHYRLKMVYAPGYNQNGLLKAQELLRTSLRVHRRGVARADVEADLVSCRELLAAGHLTVANFYEIRERPGGEILRLANAAILYPETVSGQLAQGRLLAAGFDLEALAGDSGATSVDREVPGLGPWSEDR